MLVISQKKQFCRILNQLYSYMYVGVLFLEKSFVGCSQTEIHETKGHA